jgi:hypothetical protein
MAISLVLGLIMVNMGAIVGLNLVKFRKTPIIEANPQEQSKEIA